MRENSHNESCNTAVLSVTPSNRFASATSLLVALAACVGDITPMPQADEPPKPVAPDWMSLSEQQSELFLTNRCLELAPPEVVELDNPDFRECFLRAQDATDRAWHRLGDDALRKCIDTGQACCFEKLPDDHELRSLLLQSLPRLHVSGETVEEKQKACDKQCSAQIARRPTQNLACQPSMIHAPRDPEHHRTAAMRAVVRDCETDRNAIAQCASLSGRLTRDACEDECRKAASLRAPTEAR